VKLVPQPVKWDKLCSGVAKQIFINCTLKKMEGVLAKEGYVGYIDLNGIVTDTHLPLEFHSHAYGYPTISIQHEGHDHPYR